jgi:acetyl esterase/lipase
VTPVATRHAYGKDPNQFGELYRPEATPAATVVIIHGGFWRAQYDLSLGRPLAANLARRGYTVWNLEYRRVGQGGGWPGTFEDVAAGIDLLRELGVATGHVCAIGHSAGGHLAGWALARALLPAGAPGAQPQVVTSAAVSQAGVLDLATAATERVGASAVPDLMGGAPDELPERYRLADPIALLPVPAPVLCVHARDDDVVPLAQSTAYVDRARATGSSARLVPVDGDHFTVIDPASAAWQVVVDALPALLEH